MTGPSAFQGMVHETAGGVYTVALDSGERVEASIRGRLKQQARTGSRVVIGDRVGVEPAGENWTIESVAERRSELVRRGRGRAPKLLAANLDQVFVTVALRKPTATTQLIDRLLVLVESSGMHPELVLNKVDLDDDRELATNLSELYSGIGYGVHLVSAESGEGIEGLHAEMCSGASAFIGPSGVGKSSLLNAIDPVLQLRTGELSRKTGTGRHTTVGSRMIRLECGGLVADTPGFGDVGLWAVAPEELSDSLPEFRALAGECRFRGCAHVKEPDCAVQAGVERGEVAASRYQSYLTLRAEAVEAEDRY